MILWEFHPADLEGVSSSLLSPFRVVTELADDQDGMKGGANLMGADLYKNLQQYWINHLKDVRAVSLSSLSLLLLMSH